MCPASFYESALPKHRVRLWSTASAFGGLRPPLEDVSASGGCVRLWRMCPPLEDVSAFGGCKYTGLPARIRPEIGLSATLVGMIVHESGFG